ncbi:sulfite reductase flavoprotein subunit alpha [Psychrobacter sp. HD31]|uniref:diflavin oxidoreductase n=1 Tax=Psychrobacter sp. HD31 TaxID=3112003 RepID=UPI003DA22D06
MTKDNPQQQEQTSGFFGWLKSLLGLTEIDMGLSDFDDSAGKHLTIIYGTQTGNAQSVAEMVAEQAKAIGLDTSLRDMETVDISIFKELEHLLVVTSTFDDGGMPENAEALWESICDPSAPMLNGLKYSVLGLGDSTYLNFCMAGKEWDARLEALGCVSMVDRVDCDVDYEAPSTAWAQNVLTIIAKAYGLQDNLGNLTNLSSQQAPTHVQYTHNRKNPLNAKMLTKKVLTAANSTKQIMHYELDISELADLNGNNDNMPLYAEGDAIHILPKNNSNLVQDVLSYFAVTQATQEHAALVNQFTNEIEIRTPSKELVKLVAEKGGNDELNRLLANNDPEALDDFLWGKDSLTLIKTYADKKIALNEFKAVCSPLVARAYSISSSPHKHPHQVHMTVRSVRYNTAQKEHSGVASTYLADMVNEGDTLQCYFTSNASFKLPEDGSLPIIMVGPGTGIAPFRSFLEAREMTQATGDNWLLFGDRNAATDFIYREEVEAMQASGLLTKLSLAFSRDQAEKIYVQDRMKEEGAELFAWLERGGYFYICGDAYRMAKDVDKALHELIAEHGKMSDLDAMAYVNKLQKQKRYVKDVY